MASTINASLTSGLVSSADTSGIIQLQSNGTTIMTVTSTGVTTQVGAPAFSAYSNATQSISTGTNTKVQFNTKEFDTNSNYDNTTNYRFTPTVAGYYQLNATTYFNSFPSTANHVGIFYKNGSQYRWVYNLLGGTQGSGSIVTYLNGSTDYIEFYVFQNSGSSYNLAASSGSTSYVQFSGALIRSA